MSLVLNHFRSHVFKRAAEGISLLVCVGLHAPAEITNLDDVALLNEYVLRFDVSVNEALFVQVIYTRANLNEKVEGCVLAQVLFFADQVKKVSF